MTKAPLGGEKTGKNPTDRAKSGVKREAKLTLDKVLTEGHGIPIALTVERANCHDKRLVEGTLRSIVIRRPKVSNRKRQNMLMDKGYETIQIPGNRSATGGTRHALRHAGKKQKRNGESLGIGRGAGLWSERIHG